jgi:hypothetical protein
MQPSAKAFHSVTALALATPAQPVAASTVITPSPRSVFMIVAPLF